MQSPLPDSLQPARSLFLDFVDVASGGITGASARALLEKARASLRGLDDDTLMLLAARAKDASLAEEAVRLTAAIARLEPKRAAGWFAAGLALQFANRHADAVRPYRHALAICRTFANLRNNLATALIQINFDSSEILALLEETVASEPDNVSAWINLGHLLPVDTDPARPLEASRRALALAPHSPLALNNYAMAC